MRAAPQRRDAASLRPGHIFPSLRRAGRWSRWPQDREPGEGKPGQKSARNNAAKAQQSQLIDYASVVDPPKQAAAARGRPPQARKQTKPDGAARSTDGAAPRQQSKGQQARAAAKAAAGATAQLHAPTAIVQAAATAEETAVARLWQQYYRPAALIFTSAHMLATACAVTGVHWPHSLPAGCNGLSSHHMNSI